MLAQIIFFLALAMFIYLLAHRYSFGNIKTNKVLNALKSWLILLVKFLIIQVSKIRIPKVNIPKINKSLKLNKPAKSSNGDLGASNDFWSEEGIADKPELSSHFEEGEQLFKKGRYKDAERFFLKAATNNPGDPKVYARLGLLYLAQKNFSDAIEALKVAVKLEKYNPSRHYNLSLAYWGNKDTRRSISSVREAISLDPITKKYRQLLEQLLNG